MNINEVHLVKSDRELIEFLEELRRILNVSYQVDAGITGTYKKLVQVCSEHGYTLKKNME